MLFYSRVSRIDLSFDAVDINSVIDDIKLSLEHKLETNECVIDVHRALPVVNCDKARISEIFRNLIENAFKYNDKDQKIVEIGFCKKMNWIRVHLLQISLILSLIMKCSFT